MVKRTSVRRAGHEPASGWSTGLSVEVGGRGVIGHAGAVLPRLLADRIGLTGGLRQVVVRRRFTPGRDRGRLLTDTITAMVAGASCLADVEALTRQEALYGPGGAASDTTVLRGLSEFADQLTDDGLPGPKLAGMLACVRAAAWAQIVAADQGRLPAVSVAGLPLTRAGSADQPAAVTVVRIDATIIESATMKPSVAGHYKGGIGWHPLTAWCSNVVIIWS